MPIELSLSRAPRRQRSSAARRTLRASGTLAAAPGSSSRGSATERGPAGAGEESREEARRQRGGLEHRLCESAAQGRRGGRQAQRRADISERILGRGDGAGAPSWRGSKLSRRCRRQWGEKLASQTQSRDDK
ncbi:hypothetical protein KM043_012345 [Ampulex compressa]|nr:hypothetical protein KM043_012345 [Ampulex compressa]